MRLTDGGRIGSSGRSRTRRVSTTFPLSPVGLSRPRGTTSGWFRSTLRQNQIFPLGKLGTSVHSVIWLLNWVVAWVSTTLHAPPKIWQKIPKNLWSSNSMNFRFLDVWGTRWSPRGRKKWFVRSKVAHGYRKLLVGDQSYLKLVSAERGATGAAEMGGDAWEANIGQVANLEGETNIATGETSPAITPYHTYHFSISTSFTFITRKLPPQDDFHHFITFTTR